MDTNHTTLARRTVLTALATLLLSVQSAYADTSITDNITEDTTWTAASNVYVIENSISISSGATLTVEPGVVVKFKTTTSRLTVNGTLDAQGTAGSEIYFTSYHDDSIGGDTNGNGTSTTPAAEDWRWIEIPTGGTANLEHAVVRYGGSISSTPDYHTNIYGGGGELTIATSTVSNARNCGTITGTRCGGCAFVRAVGEF